jgi:hypothetical protein
LNQVPQKIKLLQKAAGAKELRDEARDQPRLARLLHQACAAVPLIGLAGDILRWEPNGSSDFV